MGWDDIGLAWNDDHHVTIVSYLRPIPKFGRLD